MNLLDLLSMEQYNELNSAATISGTGWTGQRKGPTLATTVAKLIVKSVLHRHEMLMP